MARKAREQSGTGIYHVMLRGVNRQDIFEDDEDYRVFISILSKLSARQSDDGKSVICTCEVFAYCLMPIHVHLLLMEKEWHLAEIIKLIASCYVFHFNKKYGRIGHLFQDRFKSEPCNDSDYFFTLIRYIHQNPLKAGMVSNAVDYVYSSWYNDYMGLGAQRLCHIQPVLNRISMEALKGLVETPLPERYGCIDIEDKAVVSDEEVRCYLLSKSGAKSITSFLSLDKCMQKTFISETMRCYRVGPRQMSRVTGISYSVIQRIPK